MDIGHNILIDRGSCSIPHYVGTMGATLNSTFPRCTIAWLDTHNPNNAKEAWLIRSSVAGS
jgi:hypothetical protein